MLLSPHLLKWYIGLFIVIIGIYRLIKIYQRKEAIVHPLNPISIVTMSILCACLSGMAAVELGVTMLLFLSQYAIIDW